MMAKEKLQIVLDADWRGKSAIQGANKSINKLDDSVGKAKINIAKFAVAGAAAFAAIGVAAAIAWKTMSEGAALLQARDHFDRLTAAIDSTSDAMMSRLREATRGMVSDAKLIAGANEIMVGKLAKSEDAVVRLAAVAGALNWDMGILAQTINNQSVLRLDNLRVAVEDVIPRFNELKSAGLSVKEAFTIALTEAGEKQWLLLGDAADTAAGKLQNIINVGENAKTAFQESFATELAEQLDDASESAAETEDALVGLAASAGVSFASMVAQAQDAVLAILRIQLAIATVKLALSKVINTNLPGHAETVAANELDLRNLGIQLADLQGMTVPSMTAHFDPLDPNDQLLLAQAAIASRSEGVTEALDKQTDAMIINSGAAVTLEQEMGLIAGASDKATAALEDAAGSTDDLTGGLYGVSSAAETAAEQMARLAAETGAFFDQARRSDDFDPAEAFYSAALAAGASAEQLQQLLVGTGLETPERAQEIYNESIQRQLAQQAGQAYKEGGNLDMLWQGVQAGMANPSWAQQVTQSVSNQTDVGGISLEFNIYGNITGEELDMVVDNAIGEAVEQIGD